MEEKGKGLIDIKSLTKINIVITILMIFSNLFLIFGASFCDDNTPNALMNNNTISLNSKLLIFLWVIFCILSIGLGETINVIRRYLLIVSSLILLDFLIIILLEFISFGSVGMIIWHLAGGILLIINLFYLTRPKVKEQFR